MTNHEFAIAQLVLQQALAQGKNPEKVLKELREFKPAHHSSTVGSSASAGVPEVDKTTSIVSFTSSEDENSPFKKTVVSAQTETPRIRTTKASTSQVQKTKDSKAGSRSPEQFFKPRASLSRTPPKPRESEESWQESPLEVIVPEPTSSRPTDLLQGCNNPCPPPVIRERNRPETC